MEPPAPVINTVLLAKYSENICRLGHVTASRWKSSEKDVFLGKKTPGKYEKSYLRSDSEHYDSF